MSNQNISEINKYLVEQIDKTFTIYSSNRECIYKFEKENDLVIPFLFFASGSKEYLIANHSKNKYLIVDCWIGHIEEGETLDDYQWKSIYQMDNKTIGILGNDHQYSFFHFKRTKLTKLDIYREDKLFTHRLSKEPEIKNKEYGVVDFHLYRTHVNGIAIQNNTKNVSEIDMEITKYTKQESQIDGFTLPFYQSKTYPFSYVKIEFQRQGDRIVVCSFWNRDEISKDNPEIYYAELFPYLNNIKNNHICIPSRIIIDQDKAKYILYFYPTQSWKLIRNYFILTFEKVEDGYYYHLKTMSFKNGNICCLSTHNVDKVINLLN